MKKEHVIRNRKKKKQREQFKAGKRIGKKN
jgi:hypothetical protein